MPTYGFKCECGYTEEKTMTIADYTEAVRNGASFGCPECGQELQRVWHIGGIQIN